MLLRANKWTATAASIWIQCTSGSAYCFGIYSPLLKSTLSYDQSNLGTVAFFKDLGANVGVLAGLLHDSSSSSPWVVLAAGAAQCFAGYFLIWLTVTGHLPSPPVPLMCFYMLLAAHAQPFFNTANIVTAVNNFPDHRDTIIGIMKGFLGLSGAILIQVYRTLYNEKPEYFILMVALLPAFLLLLLMYFVKVHHTDRRDDKQLLDGLSLIALVIAGYLMTIMIWENVQTLGSLVRTLNFIVLLLLLSSPIIIVIWGQLRDTWILSNSPCLERIRLMDNADTSEVTDKRKCDTMAAEKPSLIHDRIPLQRGENFNLFQAMQTLDFWLLFLSVACGLGSGLATINNIGQIGSSLGYTSMEISALVSLWSKWNFLGRFGSGYISDYFLHSRGYGRPLFMAITLIIMSGGHILISSGLPGVLILGSILVGVCYGSQWALMPTVTSEIFGLRHLGTIFNAIAIASPLGSYILSVRVVGYIYDVETSSSATKVCAGRHCFMHSFLILASVSLFGFIVALTLFLRTKMFYKQVISARLHSAALGGMTCAIVFR